MTPVRTLMAMLVGGLVLTATAQRAGAVLVASDDFESYSAGASLNGQAGGTGWAGNWVAVSGVTTQTASVTNGGSFSAEISNATDNAKAVARAFASRSATTYFSVRFKVVAGLSTNDFLHFYLSNSTNDNSGGIGLLSTTTDRLGARVGTSNGGDTTSSSIDAVQGTTYLLVGKLWKDGSSNFNRIDLFVNPTTSVEPLTPSATDIASTGQGSVSVFGVRSFNFDLNDRYQFDDVRIASTFAEVVPTVPEPTGLALLGLAAAPLLRRPRQR